MTGLNVSLLLLLLMVLFYLFIQDYAVLKEMRVVVYVAQFSPVHLRQKKFNNINETFRRVIGIVYDIWRHLYNIW